MYLFSLRNSKMDTGFQFKASEDHREFGDHIFPVKIHPYKQGISIWSASMHI